MSDTPTCESTRVLMHNRTGECQEFVPYEVARELELELIRLRGIVDGAEVIWNYSGKEGRREWWMSGEWLYPGDQIWMVNTRPVNRATISTSEQLTQKTPQ